MLQFNTMSGCAKLTQLAALIYSCIYVPALLAEDYFAPDFIETIMSMFISTEITSTRATSYLSVMKAI